MTNIAYKERCAPLLPEDPERCSGLNVGGAGAPGKTDATLSGPSAANQTSDESALVNEGVHLLSLFPLTNMPEFARVSCMPVMHVPTPCGAPFCVSRPELRTLLARIMPVARAETVIATLDRKVDVQLSIRDDDARALGFMAKIQ